jgi:hypothetical protein
MLTVEYVKNLKWADESHTVIECTVKYAEFDEEHPSGVDGVDTYPHIQEIWAKANAGEYGPIAEYTPLEAVGSSIQILMPE